MDSKKDLALFGFLSVGMSGCFNNLTEEEKRRVNQFLDDPTNAEHIDFGHGRIMGHPVAISRLRNEVRERKTTEPIQTTCYLCWGRNLPLEPEQLQKIFEQMMKGG